MNEEQAKKLKVVELRAELNKRGLNTKGVKVVLLDTLLKALREEQSNAEVENEEVVQASVVESTVQGADDINIQEEDKVTSSSIATATPADDGNQVTTSTSEVKQDFSESEIISPNSQETVRKESPAKKRYERRSTRGHDASGISNIAKDETSLTQEVNKQAAVADVLEGNTELTKNQTMQENNNQSVTQMEDGSEEAALTSEIADEKADDSPIMQGENEDMQVETNSIKVPQVVAQHEGGRARKRKADEAFDEQDENENDQAVSEQPQQIKVQVREITDRRTDSEERSEDMSDFWSDEFDDSSFILDRYNSDLHVKLSKNGLIAEDLHSNGFAYLWGGARATYGAKSGKVYFEVKVLQYSQVDLPDPETHKNALRVGWSIDSPYFQLGEDKYSYGFGSSGKAATTSNFFSYGKEYTVGDVIGCYLDLQSEPNTVGFLKNNEDLGSAFQLSVDLSGKALFPHIYIKNTRIQVNFGTDGNVWYDPPPGYSFIGALPPDELERGMKGPDRNEDCEVLMMVGLPGAGKTTWAEKYCKEHPDKRYYVLGTNLIMERMRVTGLQRKYNYQGRFQELICLSAECLNKLFSMAGKMKRNYILDQTNVYATAQKNKMRWFDKFRKKAIVVVPKHDELQKRSVLQKEKENKDIPSDTIREMKNNFVLPAVGDIFESVDYVEEPEEVASKIVSDYHREASSSSSTRKHPRTDSYRWSSDRSRKDRNPHASHNQRSNHPDRRHYNNSSQRRWGHEQRRGAPRSRPPGQQVYRSQGRSQRIPGYHDHASDRSDYNYHASQYSDPRDTGYGRTPAVPRQPQGVPSQSQYYASTQDGRTAQSYYHSSTGYPSGYDQAKSYQSYDTTQGYATGSSSQYAQNYSQTTYDNSSSRQYDSTYANQAGYSDPYNRSGYSSYPGQTRSSQGYNTGSANSNQYYRRD